MTPPPSPNPEFAAADAAEIAALNGAIVALLDNVDEYRRAAFALEHRLNEYQQRIHLRMQSVEALQARVRQLGAQPATTRSLLATAFAGILSARPSITRNEEKDLVEDAERGEASVMNHLRRALSKLHFSEATRDRLRAALDALIKRPTPDRSLAEVCNAGTPAVNAAQFETAALNA